VTVVAVKIVTVVGIVIVLEMTIVVGGSWVVVEVVVKVVEPETVSVIVRLETSVLVISLENVTVDVGRAVVIRLVAVLLALTMVVRL
jgi:hypothetical protein